MAKGFVSKGITGMNNVQDESDLSTPKVVLNANVGIDGSAKKRPGQTLVVNLPGAHSLYFHEPSTTTLCMACGVLYELTGPTLTPSVLLDTKQPDAPLHFVPVSGRLYISNQHWCGVFNIKTREMEPWGTPVPDAPVLLPGTGNLPNGRYSVVITMPGPEGRISGNSRISFIEIQHDDDSDEDGGIVLPTIPDNATVWISDPNSVSPVFYRAGETDHVTELPDNPEPLYTLWGSPPLPMTCITWAFGMLWGFRGNKLYHSEPYQPELFKLSECTFDFDSPGGMIAETPGGLFIGTKDATYFFAGRTPEEMIQKEVAPGVVPGTLCYASEFGSLGRKVPIWIGRKSGTMEGGVFAGTADGQVINLLKERISITPDQAHGASIFRVKDGKTQMLFSFKYGGGSLTDMAIGDDASCEVIRKGTVI